MVRLLVKLFALLQCLCKIHSKAIQVIQQRAGRCGLYQAIQQERYICLQVNYGSCLLHQLHVAMKARRTTAAGYDSISGSRIDDIL